MNKPSIAVSNEQLLAGWGRYPVSHAQLLAVASEGEALRHLRQRQGKQLLARGSGRAYGDSALNQGNLCLDFTPMGRFLGFDAQTGWVHAEAGVTLEQVLETFVPHGWMLPVTPGTKYPTLGGSVACDVHGKSHFSFSHCVEKLHLMLADGSVVECSRKKQPELFWATFGGMGLTGLILSVEMRLQAIESSYVNYEGIKAANLDEIFRLFEETDEKLMTVAWIDCLARGKNLGRSIMMRGSFAKRHELQTTGQKQHPLYVPHKRKWLVPVDFPGITLNPLTMNAFNLAYYGKHPRRLQTLMDYDSFFYPLDAVLHWNRVYGKQGMLQYQFLIPPTVSFDGIKALLEAISATGKGSFLAVLKKFGAMKNEGMLSFPMPGYFIALDFPYGDGSVLSDMNRWDELVLKFGGRLYLAKDSRMQAETFAAMYPRLAEWQRIKAKVDPENIFVSDQARRLNLLPGSKPQRPTGWSRQAQRARKR